MKTLFICLLLLSILFLTLKLNNKDFFTVNNNQDTVINSVNIGSNSRPDTNFINNNNLNIGLNTKGGSVNSNNPINIGCVSLTAQMIRDLKNFYYPYFTKNGEFIPGSIFDASTKGKWEGVPISIQTQSITDKAAYNREFREKCKALGPDHEVNEAQLVTGKNYDYPGCLSNACCKVVTPPVKKVYDQLCIGDTCINGEDLKILTYDNIFNLKSGLTDQCLNFSSNPIALSGSYAKDMRNIKFATQSPCPQSTTESRETNNWFQLWPGKEISSINKKIID